MTRAPPRLPPPSHYRRLALEGGADFARLLDARRVRTAAWVRHKCQFGCSGFAGCLCCPPYSPTPEDTCRLLSGYHRALFIAFHFHAPQGNRQRKRKSKNLAVTLERTAFLDGYHKALAYSNGPCSLCASCDTAGPCLHPERARPSMEACGIDVFATARAAGLQLHTVREGDPYWYCSLLLLD